MNNKFDQLTKAMDQNDSHDNGGVNLGDSGGPLFYVDPVTGGETLVATVSSVP